MILGDIALFERCETCNKKRFYIAKRNILFPVGNLTARSKKKMCKRCFDKTNAMLSTNSALHTNKVIR